MVRGLAKAALLFLALFFSTMAVASEQGPATVSFLPAWVPQAQFAGYYVAYEKGFFKNHNIDLTILTGGPGRPPDSFLENQRADFAVLWLSRAIQMRAGGADIVNIGQIVQKSGLMLVAKKSSGIAKPQDMNGKKVGLWGGPFKIQPEAFFKHFGIKVIEVPQSFSVNLFLRGGVDVASAMWYNEYHTIINSGINPDELNTFFFYDYGLNFPEDGIYTLEETYRENPEVCCSFVEAAIEGWHYAFSHPKEAVDIVMSYIKKAHLPANRVHQEWMLARMKDLITPTGSTIPLGDLSVDDYMRVAGFLIRDSTITKIPPYHSFFKSCGANDEK